MTRPDTRLYIRENVLLAPYTTLGVGGPARFLIGVRYEEQALDALEFARARACPAFILGGGSNILASDSGFPGLVIRMEIRGVQPLESEDDEWVSAAAGEDWDGFVERCIEANHAGLECLSGIPGTVGAAPVQNVGAYGQEVSDVILSVRVLDRETLLIEELSGTDCKFAYRSSIFNTTHSDRYVILRVAFALRSHGRPSIDYEDLRRYFGDNVQAPSLRDVRRAVLSIRESKGMIFRGSDPDFRSAGSFFKNPILRAEEAAQVESQARSRGLLSIYETIPRFPAPEGKQKLPAAWFIERAGFPKGYVLGNAGISSKHALAFVNRGNARAQDFVDLMQTVQEKVQRLFGVELQPEVTFLGFDKAF